ncbi:MAG: hypothetical protein R3E90_02705 [Marinicella sp.]
MTNNQNLGSFSTHKATKNKIKRLTPIKVATRHPNSRKHAIFAKCWNCCGGQYENTSFDSEVKKSIKHCAVTNCALHPFRKFKTKIPVQTLASGTGIDLSLQQNHEVKPL